MIRIRIAVYGKGGIGKSTISANVSAALAQKGLKVLQVGCDPKHDSTRLLIGGSIPATVLDYIKEILPEERQLEDIVFSGYGGVACVEAGGPEPGVGCAGRGVITTFELLRELGLRPEYFDVSIYDVLGDVVCGGFAVPVRGEYADVVFIVTSGEYLSLYAANNILRGIKNFTETTSKVAGIIYNARGLEEEEDRVMRFARAVSLPVIAQIPRSETFADAEKQGCTIIEKYPGSAEAEIIRKIADHIERLINDRTGSLYPALPLDEKKLESIVLQRKDSADVKRFDVSVLKAPADQVNVTSPSVKNRRPLIGCAFGGAVSVAAQITDAAIVMHCPRSCLLMICEKLFDREQHSAQIYGHTYNAEFMKRFFSTDMTDEDFIFGGEKKLKETIESSISRGYKHIFIVTACPPGIIGDNIGGVVSAMLEKYPGVNLIPVEVDGNLKGDFAQGIMETYRTVAGIIRDCGETEKDRSVNIIAEKWLATNDEASMDAIEKLLKRLDISINSRFLSRVPFSSLENFSRAALNLPADAEDTSVSIKKLLSAASDVPFFDKSLPTGFRESEEWLLGVAGLFNEEEAAKRIIAEEKEEYYRKIEALKPHFEGKRVLITSYPKSVDWICDLANDLNLDILKIGLTYSPVSESFTSRYERRIEIERDYPLEKRTEDINSLKPDLVLHTYPRLRPADKARGVQIPYCPGFGFHAAVDQAEDWSRLMKVPAIEGWRKDGEAVL